MAEEVKKKRPPLDPNSAKARLGKIAAEAYSSAQAAKERGEMVGWCSSNFPVEIPETLGLAVVYPENQAAGIAARGAGERMCNISEADGYSNDICAYARISLAYAKIKSAPEQDMPQPDFLLCCNNICNCMIKWYENLAKELNIPMIMIDIPFNPDYEVSDAEVAYVRDQFRAAIKQLEELTGKKFDEKKFEQACANANRTASAWLRVCDYLQYKPAPYSGFDLFNHMADIVTARSKVQAAEAFELLEKDLEQMIKEGTTTTPFPEQYRVMFEGIPCWPKLHNLFKPLKEHGVNVTAVVYAPAFGFVYDDLDGMARAYYKAPNSVCIEQGVDWREGICRDNKVDGVLVHYNRSCKPWSGYMAEMQRRFTADLGIPCAGFDGDQADPRNFNAAQYETRVQGLVEAMAQNAMNKEG
jgi:benzoyl-CoA reductase/2-hydroxyglutaryl-CoA dehydratase subunit BcrC/BadD/HgdB